MLARIPALAGHVDAAAKGKLVVDDDDLLVVRGGDGVMAVQLGVDALVRHPLHDGEEGPPPEQRLDRAGVPAEQENLQLRLTLDERVDEVAHRLARCLVMVQNDARVEVPADQQDLPPRIQHRAACHTEIFLRIDDDRHAIGLLDRQHSCPTFNDDLPC